MSFSRSTWMFQQKMWSLALLPTTRFAKKNQPYPRFLPSPVKRNHSICCTNPWGWTGMVDGWSFNVLWKNMLPPLKTCVTFFQEWNGTDTKILHVFLFGGGVGVIVWWLSKHISDKIRIWIGWWWLVIFGRTLLEFWRMDTPNSHIWKNKKWALFQGACFSVSIC